MVVRDFISEYSNFLNGSCSPQRAGDSVYGYFDAHKPRPRRAEQPGSLPPARQRRRASTRPATATQRRAARHSAAVAPAALISDANFAFVETNFAAGCSRAGDAAECPWPSSAQRIRRSCKHVLGALADQGVRACGCSQLPHLGDGRRLRTDGAARQVAAPYWRRKAFVSKTSGCSCFLPVFPVCLPSITSSNLSRKRPKTFCADQFCVPAAPNKYFS